MFEKMSRRLEMQDDAEERERLMVGMTGVPDKDILNRFVSQRFIRQLIASNARSFATRSSLLSSRVSLSYLSKSRRIYGVPRRRDINL